MSELFIARSRARQLRVQLRELLDDADCGSMCLTQNANPLADKAEELRKVEHEIDQRMKMLVSGR
jgi:hypothetical protein